MNNQLNLERWINILTLFFLLIIATTTNAQLHEWSNEPSLSAYYTTLKMDRYSSSSGLNTNEKYFENSINLSLSAPITQKLRGGIQLMSIAHKVLREPIDRSLAVGVFTQYNFRASKKLGVYFEGGYTFSNMCPCGEAEIYTVDSLNHFIQFGLGLDYRLTSRFHLKAGLINYKPVGGLPSIYNWTQPFIGVKYHFYKNYSTPFASRFRKKAPKIPKEALSLFWQDEQQRRWNIGVSSAGQTLTQTNPLSGQVQPLARYREFTVTPRVNYWINQAVLVGVQGTFYHYENNRDTIPDANGFGTGVQARFYPLSFKDKTEYKAFRIGRRGNWNLAPIVSIEVHVANFSWLEPENAGKEWQYFDFQPLAGFVLAYKDWFNLSWNIGKTIGLPKTKEVIPSDGIRTIVLEYNLYK